MWSFQVPSSEAVQGLFEPPSRAAPVSSYGMSRAWAGSWPIEGISGSSSSLYTSAGGSGGSGGGPGGGGGAGGDEGVGTSGGSPFCGWEPLQNQRFRTLANASHRAKTSGRTRPPAERGYREERTVRNAAPGAVGPTEARWPWTTR